MYARIALHLLRKLAAKPKTIWFGLVAILAVVIGVSALRARLDASSSVLVGRIWIDHLPKKDTEHFEVFVAIEDGAVGVFERASVYEGAFEVFKYEPKGDGRLELLFPQSKKKFDVTYEAKACRDGDFDYCLSLSGARTARRTAL